MGQLMGGIFLRNTFVCFASPCGMLVYKLATSIETRIMSFATFVFSIKLKKSVASLGHDFCILAAYCILRNETKRNKMMNRNLSGVLLDIFYCKLFYRFIHHFVSFRNRLKEVINKSDEIRSAGLSQPDVICLLTGFGV